MPNGRPVNPLVAPLAAIKQIGEQTNVGIQSIGTGLAQVASQGLDTLMSAAPPIPGIPAAGGFQLPTGQMPNLTQALAQVENVLIPPGLPRPSQALAQMPAAPTPQAQNQPPQPARTGRVQNMMAGGY